tara:strand:- start:1064 stop:1456 length:393 start_codon:yes stop_codon:yes gene_type:complete
MKFWNYVIIATGLALIFELAGIPIASNLLTTLGITEAGVEVQGAALWTSILGISVVGSIIIGALFRTSPENYIIWPIIIASGLGFIVPLAGIYATAINYDPWIRYIVYFISSLLTIGFVFAVIEFFRGSD